MRSWPAVAASMWSVVVVVDVDNTAPAGRCAGVGGASDDRAPALLSRWAFRSLATPSPVGVVVVIAVEALVGRVGGRRAPARSSGNRARTSVVVGRAAGVNGWRLVVVGRSVELCRQYEVFVSAVSWWCGHVGGFGFGAKCEVVVPHVVAGRVMGCGMSKALVWVCRPSIVAIGRHSSRSLAFMWGASGGREVKRLACRSDRVPAPSW